LFEAAHGNELTAAHIDYLRRKLDTNYETHTELVAWQQFFVDTAATTGFKEFTQACDYWLVHVDPDGKEPKDQLINNHLSLTNGPGGRLKIKGEVDAATGQALRTALDHEMNKLRRDDVDTNSTDRQAAPCSLALMASSAPGHLRRFVSLRAGRAQVLRRRTAQRIRQ